ncbi:probable aspartic proteinase GIP1 [Lycium barbarum]|uniref:probable aspartic proteinase GIP1 n=1 Tax=Lycium barbarum TaxID=112863 RepID=UPI00293F2F65|nr:probable aspartic proteinase GIP1 [Lycium barbarum]
MLLYFFFAFSLFISPPSPSPSSLAPITKDHETHLYTLSLYLKTPPQATTLLLDLNAPFSWIHCSDNNNISSTYHSISCNSPLCSALGSRACAKCHHSPNTDCSNDPCILSPLNSVTHKTSTGKVITGSLALPVTDGRNPGQLKGFDEFLLSCSKKSLLKGLTKGVAGLAGLGRSRFSLTTQVSTSFSSTRTFALCLTGSPSAPGVAFFGSLGPYHFLPEIDLSKTLHYTPLVQNPVQSDYFISLTSIKVNGVNVQLDQNNILTKLSTVTPYTTLQSNIYKVFTETFVNESAKVNLTVTNPMEPFKVCYNADEVLDTKVGPAVPTVDLVMEGDDVFWRIFGSNSMVRIARDGVDVWCLGVSDGGIRTETLIVIGGHQMEDNLMQFDLDQQRLGFSSSVLAYNTSCSNFNFTTVSNLS